MKMVSELRNEPSRRPGRPPGPIRCVVQVRSKGTRHKAVSYSFTVRLGFGEAMKRVQEAFADVAHIKS